MTRPSQALGPSAEPLVCPRLGTRQRNLMWFACCFLVLLLSGAELEAGEKVRLTLSGGETVEGRVYDLGAESLEVSLRHGSRRVAKQKVERWVLVPGDKSKPKESLIVLKTGQEISGAVNFSADTGEWVVSMDLGAARYPDEQVIRVVHPDGTCTDGSYTPRVGFEKRIDRAIEQVRSKGEADRVAGRDYLVRCGFFAVPQLERAAKGAEAHPVLQRILLDQRILAAIPEGLEEALPGFVAGVTTGSAEDRAALLQDAFLERGAEMFGMLSVLLLDESQPAAVRAFSVEMLQGLNRVKELVKAYQLATGRAQFAIAIALGDAGIYVGIPTLIEALQLNDPQIQQLAARKLEEYTGNAFGYASDQPEAQRAALARWQEWWRTNRSEVEKHLSEHLDPQIQSSSRVRAVGLWRQGNDAWGREEITRAYDLFQAAVAEDPTYMAPFICLGIICYQEQARDRDAEKWFLRAIKRSPEEGEEELQKLAYYHLGRIHSKYLQSDLAKRSYLKAIAIDPHYIDAWFDLGRVIYQAALHDGKDPTDRRDRFGEAVRVFEDGLKHLEEFRSSLVVLSRANLPVGSDLPFSPREHNRSLKKLREHLTRFEGRFAYRIAQTRFALGEHATAAQWATRSVELPGVRPDYHLLLAAAYEAMGRTSEAKRERDRAARLSGDQSKSRPGSR